MTNTVKKILSLLIVLALSGCSTIRMKYEGEFKTEDGKAGTVIAEKSYDMGNGDSTLCGITAIFFGGYCWYFAVMPTTQQRAQMEADVKMSLQESLKTDKYTLDMTKNDKINWEPGEDTLQISMNSSKSPFKNKKISE